MNFNEHFYRLDLAKGYVAQCLGHVAFSTAPTGLFLAGARRTGKSEFLRNDLTQVFEAQGAFVVYVDLWENGGALGSLDGRCAFRIDGRRLRRRRRNAALRTRVRLHHGNAGQ